MNITKDNYSSLYLEIKNKLLTCKFISFDEEMTGINSYNNLNKYYKDDLPFKRYSKMLSIVNKYNIIQFGICFFHEVYNSDNNTIELIASPYNFYLFPNYGIDIILNCNSIDFLRKNNMDFGLWINKGITYVDLNGDELLKKKYFISSTSTSSTSTTTNDNNDNNNGNSSGRKQIVLTKKSDLDFMESNFDRFKQFLNSEAEIFEFEDCNSYLRRYIYEHVETCYSKEVVLKKKENNRLYAYKVSKELNEEYELEQKLQREKDYTEAIGFRQFYLDLVESKKPIVGHNNLFDLMFMLRWLDSPLPSNFQDFRTYLHSQFPSIYDTKYIETYLQSIQSLSSSSLSLSQQSQDTYLEQCYNKYLQANNNGNGNGNNIVIKISPDCSSFDPSSPNYHNAGYDAYCTGYVFANQMYRNGDNVIDAELELNKDHNGQPLIQVTENKLFLMFSFYQLDLNPNNSPISPRYLNSVLLRVTNFNKEITTETILGVETHNTTITYDANLEIIWIDDNSFFIVFPNSKEDDERVINYQKYAPSNWNFQTVDEFLASLENNQALKNKSDKDEQDIEKSDEIIEEDSIHIKGTPTKRVEKNKGSFLGQAFNALLSPFRWASSIDQTNDDDEENDDNQNNLRQKRKREE